LFVFSVFFLFFFLFFICLLGFVIFWFVGGLFLVLFGGVCLFLVRVFVCLLFLGVGCGWVLPTKPPPFPNLCCLFFFCGDPKNEGVFFCVVVCFCFNKREFFFFF